MSFAEFIGSTLATNILLVAVVVLLGLLLMAVLETGRVTGRMVDYLISNLNYLISNNDTD